MKRMAAALVLAGVAVGGCAEHVFTWSGGDQPNLKGQHLACAAEANSAYLGGLWTLPWQARIRRTLYRDCMVKAGYTLVSEEETGKHVDPISGQVF